MSEWTWVEFSRRVNKESPSHIYIMELTIVAFTGQAYVALSRATSLDGLEVLNFDASKVYILALHSPMMV